MDQDSISKNLASLHISAHVATLENHSNAESCGCSREWAKKFPISAGVYSVFDNKKLIYVGESGSLKGRMRDLLDTRNHTLRRQLGSALFGKAEQFKSANSSTKFPDDIETKLNDYMKKNISVVVVPVSLGRKEIEEAAIAKHSPKFNVKKKRGEVSE